MSTQRPVTKCRLCCTLLRNPWHYAFCTIWKYDFASALNVRLLQATLIVPFPNNVGNNPNSKTRSQGQFVERRNRIPLVSADFSTFVLSEEIKKGSVFEKAFFFKRLGNSYRQSLNANYTKIRFNRHILHYLSWRQC